MFDIGFSELLMIAVITLVVMGPQRLPQTVRSISLWVGRARRMIGDAKRDFENEIGIDEVRRQLHNEKIMRDLDESKSEINRVINSANIDAELKQASTSSIHKPNSETVDGALTQNNSTLPDQPKQVDEKPEQNG